MDKLYIAIYSLLDLPINTLCSDSRKKGSNKEFDSNLSTSFPCLLLLPSQEVSVGQGPTFERVQFGLMGRSPLLQNYLVTHGLEERRKGGEVGRRVGPVIGRTQISKLPYPPFSSTHVN